MDSVGESIENVGIAKTINNGLPKSQQKEPIWPADDAIAAKKQELVAAGYAACKALELGKHLSSEWARAKEVSFAGESGGAAWDEFCTSKTFDLFAKYAAYADSLVKVPASNKDFAEIRPLGRGAFGVVFLVFKKDTGMALATKKIVKGLAKQNNMVDSVIVEQNVLAKVRSRFCVPLHYSYQDEVCVYLVLSLLPGGDLWFVLQQRTIDPRSGKKVEYRKIGDEAVKFYTASMAYGLQAIHDAGYVYRDLKPHNVLLDAEGQLRISDMGLCVDVSTGPVRAETDPLGPSIRHGTCGYWPPEVIREQPYTFEPDWWALGVTAFQMYCDRLPFFGNNDEEKNGKILDSEAILPTRYTHGESEVFQKLLNDFMTVDVKKRLGCTSGLEELKSHPYFNGFDWTALEEGRMAAPILPNINDINAPSKNDIAPFVKPKDVTWDEADQAKFDSGWDFFDPKLHGAEAIARIKKRKELVEALAADGLKPAKEIKPTAGGGKKKSGGCSVM